MSPTPTTDPPSASTRLGVLLDASTHLPDRALNVYGRSLATEGDGMYQRIVVGTDGSERASTAVQHAAELARLCDAQLLLVQGTGSPIAATSLYGEAIAMNPQEIVDACAAALQPVEDALRDAGTNVELHTRAESGHVALCAVAEETAADLIVVGNRGMTGARRFLGSVPNSVAHQAPCSVLIVSTD